MRGRGARVRADRSRFGLPRMALTACLTALGCAAASPSARTPGVVGNRLAPCPTSPNCVSSQAHDREQRVEPLRYDGEAAAALQRLVVLLQDMPRTRVVGRDATRVHAECTSLLFRFVDDVDFVLDDAAQVIHVRSASRVGYSDLGVNRRRVERIRSAWAQQIVP